MGMRFKLWIRPNEIDRFRKHSALIVKPTGTGLYSAEFNPDGLISHLKRGFVVGRVLDFDNRDLRRVVAEGNTFYEKGLLIAERKPEDLAGMDFVSMNPNANGQYVEEVFKTYYSPSVERESSLKNFNNRFVLFMGR